MPTVTLGVDELAIHTTDTFGHFAVHLPNGTVLHLAVSEREGGGTNVLAYLQSGQHVEFAALHEDMSLVRLVLSGTTRDDDSVVPDTLLPIDQNHVLAVG